MRLRAGPQTCTAEYSSKEISPTALSHSAVPDVFEVFRTSQDTDFVRESVRVAMQELIGTEATAAAGAACSSRPEWRTTERDGTRQRLLTTHAGDIQPAIPHLRHRPLCACGGSPDRAVPWTATTTPSGGVTYELLNREPLHDVLDLISEAESFRTEFTTIRPHGALSWNRPREVPRGLADPTIPTVQTAVILPTP